MQPNFRAKALELQVQWQEPSWAKLAREEAEGYNTKASPVAPS